MGASRWVVVGGGVVACVALLALPSNARVWGLLVVLLAVVALVFGRRPVREVRNDVAEVVAGRIVQVGVLNAPLVVGRSEPANRLPGYTKVFTGRSAELNGLLLAITWALERPGPVVHVVHGPAGIGKTELVLRFGHLMGDWFDWPLYLDVGGAEDGTPEDDLAQLLADPDVGARQSGSAAGLRSLWRSRVAGSRVLLVLDNVDSAEQVLRLLPDRRDCPFLVVLVVSRSPHDELRARVDAQHLELGAFPSEDAVTLLRRCSGRELSDDERVSARELVRRCRYSPQEIRLHGARLHTEALSVGGLLAQVPDPVEEGDRPTPAFEQAYDRIGPAARHLLRHLALHPGPDFDAAAAGALAGREEAEVREALAVLEEGVLIARDGDRYRLHERFQRTVAGFPLLDVDGSTPEADHDVALRRLLCHYRREAVAVAAPVEPLLTRHRRPGADRSGVPDPELRARALAWFKSERANVLACLRVARGRERLDDGVVSLTDAIAGFLRHEGPWETAVELHTAAAELALGLHSPRDHAVALNDLGIVNRLLGRYEVAYSTLERAYRAIGGLAGELPEDDVRIGRGNARNEQGKVANLRSVEPFGSTWRRRSRVVLEEALELYRGAGDTIGVANAEKNLGVTWYQLDNRVRAHEHFQEALDHYAELDDHLGLAEVHNHRGFLFLESGDVADASREFRTAQAFAPTHSLLEGARALEGVGRCLLGAGDRELGSGYLREAVAGYGGLGDVGKAQELTVLLRATSGG
ncbi:tetratricopeptide repeat protein [Umezawaea sp. Da 62-37]|uniref:tetratricopeptide repeat protein n=1 Tax=Umezawaea sp. Da 62-37 TaxID=3075927 RepID=UPI0028F70469|nr:tetratricopeptide repeat protein [Umezawaea sp. Da 62-37]WNV88705.1 tetratricopeptide repeat protein [Umezawaea sp. Da 62-37]